MNLDIRDYKIERMVFLDTALRVVFRHQDASNPMKVLELNDIVGFFHDCTIENKLYWLAINSPGGVYCLDLSMRLKRPEVASFSEFFIFADEACVRFTMRAGARSYDFRNWKNSDEWLSPE